MSVHRNWDKWATACHARGQQKQKTLKLLACQQRANWPMPVGPLIQLAGLQ